MEWQRTFPEWSGTIANTSNCAWAIVGLLFKNRLILLQIKQTCQLEKRIYSYRYIKRNNTNATTRPMPQVAGIAARQCSSWVLDNLKFESDTLPARRMLIEERNFPVWKGNEPVKRQYSGSEWWWTAMPPPPPPQSRAKNEDTTQSSSQDSQPVCWICWSDTGYRRANCPTGKKEKKMERLFLAKRKRTSHFQM